LKKGWDSYEAGPPTPSAILSAILVLAELERRFLLPTKLIPTSEESILLQISIDGKEIEFEFDSDGDIGLMVTEGEHSTFFDPPRNEIPAILTEILGNG
jgi:hypothetical protein